MRGEDAYAVAVIDDGAGSPPHARGRLIELGNSNPDKRITPACAGKTLIATP